MQRAQRALDNPALDVAVEAANALQQPVVIFFAPVPFYPHANLRHYAFLAQGIPDIAERARKRGIGFVLRRYPDHSLAKFCDEVKASLVIGDENPMREPNHWRELAAKKLSVPLWTVDADVLVPSKLLEKEQYAARIIRPRLQQRLEAVPDAAGAIRRRRLNGRSRAACRRCLMMARSTSRKTGRTSTARCAGRFLSRWNRRSTEAAARLRNPQAGSLSRASRQAGSGRHQPAVAVSALRAHRSAHGRAGGREQSKAPRAAKDDFLDQLITWRELSINFVHFNPLYDSIESAPDWAHRTLAQARARQAARAPTRAQQLEQAETHDELWNAAQRQMLHAGWMHNYMRMYWAKKILEWSPSPAVAYQTAVYLNDKYFLDGRDPNGYAGIAWSIAGKFDRPWFERPIFGTIRYMSGNAARKKFDAEQVHRADGGVGRREPAV